MLSLNKNKALFGTRWHVAWLSRMIIPTCIFNRSYYIIIRVCCRHHQLCVLTKISINWNAIVTIQSMRIGMRLKCVLFQSNVWSIGDVIECRVDDDFNVDNYFWMAMDCLVALIRTKIFIIMIDCFSLSIFLFFLYIFFFFFSIFPFYWNARAGLILKKKITHKWKKKILQNKMKKKMYMIKKKKINYLWCYGTGFHRAELWSRGPDKHNYVHPHALKMITLSLYS